MKKTNASQRKANKVHQKKAGKALEILIKNAKNAEIR